MLLSSSWRIFAAIRSKAKRQWTYFLDTDRSKSRTSTSKQPFFFIIFPAKRGGGSLRNLSLFLLRSFGVHPSVGSFSRFFISSCFHPQSSTAALPLLHRPSLLSLLFPQETPQAEGFFSSLSRRWLAKISDFLRCVFIIYLLFFSFASFSFGSRLVIFPVLVPSFSSPIAISNPPNPSFRLPSNQFLQCESNQRAPIWGR